MGKHPLALLRRLTAAVLLGAALAVLGGVAAGGELGATLERASGVRWERFDPKTGKKIWDVTCKEAASTDSRNYSIKEPSVSVRGSEYNIEISAARGTIRREDERNNSLLLEGGVTIKIADAGRTVIRTEKLQWLASKRVLQTESRVDVQRTDFSVSGTGMELEPHEQGREVRLVRLNKDVKATISPNASKAAIFSTISGTQESDDDRNAPPMIITSKGPMLIHRDTNVISFSESVEIHRDNLVMLCEKLEMAVDGDTRRVREVICTGGVEAVDGENGASGEALSWDAMTGLGELAGTAGKPAKTWRASATVSAPLIWLSSKDRKVLWSGRAQVFAPPQGTENLLRFGAGPAQ